MDFWSRALSPETHRSADRVGRQDLALERKAVGSAGPL